MQGRQLRVLFTGLVTVVLVWLLAWGGYAIARTTRMTGEKVKAYIRSVDFAKLSPEARRKAIADLAAKLNSLTLEERQHTRWQDEWKPWFAAMTEEEKEAFINATIPNDVKQMISSFEKMPAEKRKKTIEAALKNLREERNASPQEAGDGSTNNVSTNNVPVDPALVQKAETLGLQTFYKDSSPETKAEVAPLLEEIQRQMQSGRNLHGN